MLVNTASTLAQTHAVPLALGDPSISRWLGGSKRLSDDLRGVIHFLQHP